jgi:hypothetical protein
MVHRILRSSTADIWDVIRAASPSHQSLRSRLLKAFVLTVIVDLASAVSVYYAERNASRSGVHDFGEALFWTTAQMTTISSSLANPVTGVGRAISVLLDLYAITVVTTLAGRFSAFFCRRGEESGHAPDERRRP